jgi:hypothetical protein
MIRADPYRAHRYRDPRKRENFRGLRFSSAMLLSLYVLSTPATAIDTIRFAAREITAAGTRFENVEVKLALDPQTGLPRGRISAGSTLIGPVAFDVALSERPELGETVLTGERFAIAGGELGIEAVFTSSRWSIEGTAERIESDGLLAFTRRYINIPPDITAAGRLDGLVRFEGRAGRELPTKAYAEFRGTGVGFANGQGSFAGEGIDVRLRLQADALTGTAYSLQGDLRSAAGEALLDNTYLRLGKYPTSIDLSGRFDGDSIDIEQLNFAQQGLVRASLAANLTLGATFTDTPLDPNSVKVRHADLTLHELRFPDVYTSYLQTALAGTALDSLDTAGTISGQLHIVDNVPQAAELRLADLRVRDSQGMFHLDGLKGELYWTAEGEEPAAPSFLAWDAGGAYDIGGDGSSMRLSLRGSTAALLEPARLPIFDGALNIQQLRIVDPGQESMQVEFTGELEPISMEELTKAFGWPAFGGVVTGRIPGVLYRDNKITVAGDIEAEIFDGIVRGSNITLSDPLGQWPRLEADIRVENLDLEALTRTFEVGTITGRLEGELNNLQLFDWSPTAFDMYLGTPADDRSHREISVDAINSIANVGGTAGTGVAAAMRTGVLRFFSKYRYKRLALRCVLEDDICNLSGASISPNRYYLLEGAGVPRVDIIGNTGRVRWSELLEQIEWQIRTGGTFIVD